MGEVPLCARPQLHAGPIQRYSRVVLGSVVLGSVVLGAVGSFLDPFVTWTEETLARASLIR